MSINHQAIVRYNTLDKCLSENEYNTIDDLVKACCKALDKWSQSEKGVRRRQEQKDLEFMQSKEGWSAPIIREKETGKHTKLLRYDGRFSIGHRYLRKEEIQMLEDLKFIYSRYKDDDDYVLIERFFDRLENLPHKIAFKQMAISELLANDPEGKAKTHISTISEAIREMCDIRIPLIPNFNTRLDTEASTIKLKELGFTNLDHFTYTTNLQNLKR